MNFIYLLLLYMTYMSFNYVCILLLFIPLTHQLNFILQLGTNTMANSSPQQQISAVKEFAKTLKDAVQNPEKRREDKNDIEISIRGCPALSTQYPDFTFGLQLLIANNISMSNASVRDLENEASIIYCIPTRTPGAIYASLRLVAQFEGTTIQSQSCDPTYIDTGKTYKRTICPELQYSQETKI